MIPKHKIDEILQTASIEEIIGEFVNLKKSGRQLKALSPFANEKTPSFYVVPEKQIFKDFSTGKGGNVVSFLMEHEHFTYPEALRFLAKKYNIELEEQEQTEEQKQAESERESLYIVTAFAEEYFKEQLHNSDEGKSVGLSYFTSRGFTQDTIDSFNLGYSKDAWDNFVNAAKNKGYKQEFLLNTGLIKQSNKKENHYYDGFKGRVIFPIHNLSGRPIGFGARTLLKDKKVPKYLNSPESLIYNKSKILYGIYQAKGEIIKEDNCFLVEGYTDVISFHQSGIKNVVASSGTALTQDQIKLIKRYTANITLLYDGDAAGIRASFRGVDMILEEGMNVKMVTFPEGEDPDSFAQSKTQEELKAFVTDNAKDFIVTKTAILLQGAENDPIQRAGLIKDIVESIAKIPDAIARSVYVKECSSLLDIEEETLFNELGKIRGAEIRKQNQKANYDGYEAPIKVVQREEPKSGSASNIESQELDLLRILLNYGEQTILVEGSEGEDVEVDVASYVLFELGNDEMELSNSVNVKMLSIVSEMLEEEVWEIGRIINHPDQEIGKLAAELSTEKHHINNWEAREIRVMGETKKLKRAVEGALYSFKAKYIQKFLSESPNLILEASKSDEKEMIQLLTKQKKYEAIRGEIAKVMGRSFYVNLR